MKKQDHDVLAGLRLLFEGDVLAAERRRPDLSGQEHTIGPSSLTVR